MHAMILAAGRGERMRPLTDYKPKPLLEVAGKPLIVHHLEKLADAGFHQVVINHAWLGEQIEAALGDGQQWGVHIRYSPECPALETAGGIATALPMLGSQPFVVLSADIHSDYPYARLRQQVERLAAEPGLLAHLVLAPSQGYHPDFELDAQGRVCDSTAPRYTYANLAVLKPALLAGVTPGTPAKLGPLLHRHAAAGQISGELYAGSWFNVGSAADLAAANRHHGC